MTEQFKKWVDEHPTGVGTVFVDRRGATHWLSAFIKDCYKDAIPLCRREHIKGQGPTEHPCDTHFIIVFERKLRDFGLDGEEKP